MRLDGVRQMVMTTGTSTGPDRGARQPGPLRARRAGGGARLPIQVQIEPPADLAVDRRAARGGRRRDRHPRRVPGRRRAPARWMPGKGAVPMAEYEAAWGEAVRVFGRNRVSTYLLVGLGEDPDELVAGAGG